MQEVFFNVIKDSLSRRAFLTSLDDDIELLDDATPLMKAIVEDMPLYYDSASCILRTDIDMMKSTTELRK